MSIFLYIAVMAITTYLVRMIPFTVFRKQIKSRFIKSVLFYLPYAVLTAMTIPAIFYSTGNMMTAVAGTVVAIIMAYFNLPLIVVAVSASAAALIAHFILLYIG
ncbi:MAG: AzlD domain-containing protein [Clostridia bacterium]|nr:AzlD domain-containing protein [Clostridia bacterium]